MRFSWWHLKGSFAVPNQAAQLLDITSLFLRIYDLLSLNVEQVDERLSWGCKCICTFCVSVWISDFAYSKTRKTKLKAGGKRKHGIDAVHFMTPHQKLLAGQLGKVAGAGRDTWAVPAEMRPAPAVALDQTSCQAWSSELLSLIQGSGPIHCPGWLLARLQLSAIKAAA